jgi:hypothetical protein
MAQTGARASHSREIALLRTRDALSHSV